MSRIGKNPILVPQGVTVEIKENTVYVKGKLGELEQDFDGVTIELDDNTITVKRNSDSKDHKAKHGLYRSLVANMIEGVDKGFVKSLELVGVGYRASNQGQKLELSLGYSHNIIFEIASEIKIETESVKGKNPIINLKSHDKQLLGFVASKIRSLRKPEPYKGKGVKYVGEILRRKAGKSA